MLWSSKDRRYKIERVKLGLKEAMWLGRVHLLLESLLEN